MFIKYPKIKRLGHEDVEGILIGDVVVEEKIDGANTSIWVEDGEVICGSRTRILGDESFNGFVEYVKEHEGIQRYLKENPTHRLYGEWLVRHTIVYDELSYRQFYLFDVLTQPKEFTEIEIEDDLKKKEEAEHTSRELVRQCEWLSLADRLELIDFGIVLPKVFAVLTDPTEEIIKEYVGKTALGENGEGVVIKNKGFINKWGNRICAKVVTEDFKENNGIIFGSNNKQSDSYTEMKMVNEFMTPPRVQKVMDKLQPQIEERLDMEHTNRIIQTAYHDMFEEELWGFVKKNKEINFSVLQRLATKKAAHIYHELLTSKTKGL